MCDLGWLPSGGQTGSACVLGLPWGEADPKAGVLSLSWRPELAGAPCLPQLAFGPDRLYEEESWSGEHMCVFVLPVSVLCLKIQHLCVIKAGSS